MNNSPQARNETKEPDKTLEIQGDQTLATLWAIGTGSFAGVVVGTVVADEIRSGQFGLAMLLPISIFLLCGFQGRRRIIRLVVSGVVAAFIMTLLLLAQGYSG